MSLTLIFLESIRHSCSIFGQAEIWVKNVADFINFVA